MVVFDYFWLFVIENCKGLRYNDVKDREHLEVSGCLHLKDIVRLLKF